MRICSTGKWHVVLYGWSCKGHFHPCGPTTAPWISLNRRTVQSFIPSYSSFPLNYTLSHNDPPIFPLYCQSNTVLGKLDSKCTVGWPLLPPNSWKNICFIIWLYTECKQSVKWFCCSFLTLTLYPVCLPVSHISLILLINCLSLSGVHRSNWGQRWYSIHQSDYTSK